MDVVVCRVLFVAEVEAVSKDFLLVKYSIVSSSPGNHSQLPSCGPWLHVPRMLTLQLNPNPNHPILDGKGLME